VRQACSIRDLKKEYVLKGETVRALRGVSFDVPEGDYVAIMGPSGSGKSTLLNLLGCLDQPTSGGLYLGDDNVAQMTDDQLAEIRSRRIGFVFQAYNLIQQLTVVENIQVPLYYQGKLGPKERQRCIELASMVGLGERLSHRPTQLSGGQQQRVAIARSLVNDPYFILADEPTGNLDSRTTAEILSLFDRLNEEGRTIILVTHEDDVADRAKRVVRLRDGKLQSDVQNEPAKRKAAADKSLAIAREIAAADKAEAASMEEMNAAKVEA
jgi:putative ABC transport system ATP-binding protein